MINNIKNNTISELLAKENLNILNELKKAEVKSKRLWSSQKELINFFKNLLDIILIENNNNNDDDDDENDENDENMRMMRMMRMMKNPVRSGE